VDDAGWHAKSITPFPGAEILGSQSNMLAGQNMMMLSVLLPSLNRASETANRVKCASNLRQMGMAIMLYSNDHKGDLPDRMGELVQAGYLKPEVFICPSSGDLLPDAHGMKIEELAEWIDHNSSYVYLGEGKKARDLGAEDILACEHGDNHNHDGMNVLYGDGHVEFVRDASAAQP
jgi:prepilin-type processing-associated H-X9-DG protein